MIRDRGGLTDDERAQLERHGLRLDAQTGVVIWSPGPGEPNDPSAERGHLLFAIYLLLGPPAPITEEELAEAQSCTQTFGEQLAELGVPLPRGQEAHGG
jgi:hypothetical protein